MVTRYKTVISGIYRVRNTIDGKMYIGSSVDVTRRLWEHKNRLVGNKNENPHLQNAWNKYGADNFEFELCDEIATSINKVTRDYKKLLKDNLLFFEQLWLDNYWDWGCLYNILPIAGSALGSEHSEETKKKIKRIMNSESVRRRNSETHKNKLHSEEHKERIRQAGLGRHLSDQHKINIGISAKGRTSWNKGKEATEHMKNMVRGENNASAKLTKNKVLEIRAKHITGQYTHARLGVEYNVSRRTIGRIINNEKWRSV